MQYTFQPQEQDFSSTCQSQRDIGGPVCGALFKNPYNLCPGLYHCFHENDEQILKYQDMEK